MPVEHGELEVAQRQVAQHVHREERRRDADGRVHEREVDRKTDRARREQAAPPMLDVHVGRRRRRRRLVQERQVVDRDRSCDERDQEDHDETEISAARGVELVEDQPARHEAHERRDRHEARAMSEIAAAPPLRDEVAHDARPLRRREVVGAVIEDEQEQQRRKRVLAEQRRQHDDRQPEQGLQRAAEEHEPPAADVVAEPSGKDLGARCQQRRQRAQDGDLRRRRAQEQRKGREVRFAGADLNGVSHAVAHRVAQRLVDDGILRKLARRHT